MNPIIQVQRRATVRCCGMTLHPINELEAVIGTNKLARAIFRCPKCLKGYIRYIVGKGTTIEFVREE